LQNLAVDNATAPRSFVAAVVNHVA
jgi:hypothetical protein